MDFGPVVCMLHPSGWGGGGVQCADEGHGWLGMRPSSAHETTTTSEL